ncbi:MAG: hypothetical protein ACRD6W_02965, partial [Nitrososphaerales archaeon]
MISAKIRASKYMFVAALAALGTSAVSLATPAGAAAMTLTVSSSGTDSGNCQSADCATLGYALSQAAPGDNILLEPGTYNVSADPSGTSNTVTPSLSGLTIESDASNDGDPSNTIVDATGAINGIAVNADNVTVSGITFENSLAEGILVSPPGSASTPATVAGETIENNVVNDADQCDATPSTSQCVAEFGPGQDYGESLHLLSVTDSTVVANTVKNGDGGINLTDEMGPNDGNTIENNMVLNNGADCGITLAAHNMAALPAPQPTAGGIYHNTVEGNTSDGNGATGIGLFNAAYNNTIEGNTFNG